MAELTEYRDMQVCDLRFIRTVQEAKSIKAIRDIELLVLPNDAPEDITQALTEIPKRDIGKMIQLSTQEELDVSKYIKRKVFYKDLDVLDLRSITTLEAAQAIEGIKNIGTLILPSDALDEIKNALTTISRKNVCNVLSKPVGEEIDFSQLQGNSRTNGRVVYRNMPVLDLRPIQDPAALQKVDEIENVNILILPRHASTEVQSAIASIHRRNVNRTFYLEEDEEISVQTINGFHLLNFIPKKISMITINGMGIIPDMPMAEDAPTVYLTINGMALLHQNLKKYPNLELTINGITMYKDFNSDKIKTASSALHLDAAAISYLPEETFIVASDELSFADDVTPEILIEKKIDIYAGDTIIAPRHLIPYLTATATVGDKIVEKEN